MFLALVEMLDMRVAVRQMNGMRIEEWNLQSAHHFFRMIVATGMSQATENMVNNMGNIIDRHSSILRWWLLLNLPGNFSGSSGPD